MPGLSPVEATDASNAFLWTLYGDELYEKWISVRQQMNFENERDYVSWLMVLVDEHFMPQRNENDIPGKEVFHPSESLQSSSLVKSEVVHQEETSAWSKQQHQKQGVSGGDEITLSSDSESFSGYVDDVGVSYDSTDISTDVNSGFGEVNVVAYTNSGAVVSHTDPCQSSNRKFECHFCPYSSVNVSTDDYNSSLMSDMKPQEVTCKSESQSSTDQQFMEGDGDEITLSSDSESYNDSHNLPHPALSLDPTQCDAGEMVQAESGISNVNKSGTRFYQCKFCPVRTKYQRSLKRHIETIHEQHTLYYCPHCSFSCNRKFNLKTHIVSNHGVGSNLECSNCGKGFYCYSLLEKHFKRCSNKSANGTA